MKPDGGQCVLRCSSEAQGRHSSVVQNQKEIFLLLILHDFKWKLDLVENIVNVIFKKRTLWKIRRGGINENTSFSSITRHLSGSPLRIPQIPGKFLPCHNHSTLLLLFPEVDDNLDVS